MRKPPPSPERTETSKFALPAAPRKPWKATPSPPARSGLTRLRRNSEGGPIRRVEPGTGLTGGLRSQRPTSPPSAQHGPNVAATWSETGSPGHRDTRSAPRGRRTRPHNSFLPPLLRSRGPEHYNRGRLTGGVPARTRRSFRSENNHRGRATAMRTI